MLPLSKHNHKNYEKLPISLLSFLHFLHTNQGNSLILPKILTSNHTQLQLRKIPQLEITFFTKS